jgi:nucleotide-binding universal stress UspA family protein
MLPIKKVLCPTDFSDPSLIALKAADELASHFSSSLYVVHVIEPIPAASMYIGDSQSMEVPEEPKGFNIPEYQQHLEDSARTLLRRTIDENISEGIEVRPFLVHGDAADEITRIAEEEDIDLIVIATHGHTGWRHLVFGSVAERVVRMSSHPVLTIRVPEVKE